MVFSADRAQATVLNYGQGIFEGLKADPSNGSMGIIPLIFKNSKGLSLGSPRAIAHKAGLPHFQGPSPQERGENPAMGVAIGIEMDINHDISQYFTGIYWDSHISKSSLIY